MSEDQRIKSYELKKIEKVINEYSLPTAKLWSIKPHQYRIQLTLTALNEVHIISGPVVQIILKWPDVQPNLNTILRRVFSYINAHKGVLHSLELQPLAHILQHDKNYRGWITKQFGEIAEILPDLIPKRRIKYRRKVTLEAVDTKTGVVIEIKDNTGVRNQWDMENDARHELSRKVKEVEDTLREKEKFDEQTRSLERLNVVMDRVEMYLHNITVPSNMQIVQFDHYQTLSIAMMYEH